MVEIRTDIRDIPRRPVIIDEPIRKVIGSPPKVRINADISTMEDEVKRCDPKAISEVRIIDNTVRVSWEDKLISDNERNDYINKVGRLIGDFQANCACTKYLPKHPTHTYPTKRYG